MATADEYSGLVPTFLSTVLSQPAGAIPKGAQWVVQFGSGSNTENYTGGIPDVIRSVDEYESYGGGWDINAGFSAVVNSTYQGKTCMFAQAVQIPGESFQAQADGGIQKNGFTQGYIGQGRNAPEKLVISFLETNVDFVDNVLRPWTIMTAHLGMVSRPAGQSYRSNVVFHKLGITTANTPPTVLGSYNFVGVCPVSVEGHEYTYAPYSNPIRKSATFAYHYYTYNSSESYFTS